MPLAIPRRVVVRKDGPIDEARDERGRWTDGSIEAKLLAQTESPVREVPPEQFRVGFIAPSGHIFDNGGLSLHNSVERGTRENLSGRGGRGYLRAYRTSSGLEVFGHVPLTDGQRQSVVALARHLIEDKDIQPASITADGPTGTVRQAEFFTTGDLLRHLRRVGFIKIGVTKGLPIPARLHRPVLSNLDRVRRRADRRAQHYEAPFAALYAWLRARWQARWDAAATPARLAVGAYEAILNEVFPIYEVGDDALTRVDRSLADVMLHSRGRVQKDGPIDEARDERGRWTDGGYTGDLSHFLVADAKQDSQGNWTLRNQAGKALGPDDEVIVFHGTDAPVADRFLREGIGPKPMTEARRLYEADPNARRYGPRGGLGDKLTVTAMPMVALNYGDAVIAGRVKLRDLEVVPEEKMHGVTSPFRGLVSSQGAQIHGSKIKHLRRYDYTINHVRGERPRVGLANLIAISKALPPIAALEALLRGGANPNVLRAATVTRLRLIREISEFSRDAIHDVLLDASKGSLPPAEVARRLKGLVGLTQTQTNAVQNYRRLLEAGDHGEALTRALRDKRFDRSLQGQPLAPEKIDQMVDRYAERMHAYRAQNIARTEGIRTLAEGNHASWQDAIDAGTVVRGDLIRSWIVAEDERTCPVCAAIPGMNPDGVGFDQPFDSPDGPVSLPPAHPSCFPAGTLMQGQFVAGLRAEYAGEMVVLRTAGGRELTVTPKHPILTPQGFVPAHSLSPSDYLVCYEAGNDRTRLAPFHEQDQPAMIEQVFHALAKTVFPCPPSVKDLHGDAINVQGNIEIVGADRVLLKGLLPEPLGNLCFKKPDMELTLEIGLSKPGLCQHGFRTASVSGPGGPHLSDDGGTVLLEAAPLQPLRVGPASHIDASLYEPAGEDVAPDSGLVAEPLEGFTALVPTDQAGEVWDYGSLHQASRFSLTPEDNPGLTKRFGEVRSSGSKLALELMDGYPGTVTADQITEVSRAQFQGHVYDLQSVGGWNVANGIVVSNCRCLIFTQPAVRNVLGGVPATPPLTDLPMPGDFALTI